MSYMLDNSCRLGYAARAPCAVCVIAYADERRRAAARGPPGPYLHTARAIVCVCGIAHADCGTRATDRAPLTHDPTHDDTILHYRERLHAAAEAAAAEAAGAAPAPERAGESGGRRGGRVCV